MKGLRAARRVRAVAAEMTDGNARAAMSCVPEAGAAIEGTMHAVTTARSDERRISTGEKTLVSEVRCWAVSPHFIPGPEGGAAEAHRAAILASG